MDIFHTELDTHAKWMDFMIGIHLVGVAYNL